MTNKIPGVLLLALNFGMVAVGAPAYEVRGLTEPIGDVALSASVPGILAAIHRGEGEFVKAGETVIELENRGEVLEVERRRVLHETLKGELARSELLLKTSSSIPREEVERKRGELQIAEAELLQAREQLARRSVVSPISGTVTIVPRKVGEYCQTGEVLARVVDSREFYCVSNVDPARAGHLKVGDAIAMTVPAGAGSVEVLGRIVFVSPVVDPASGLLRIRVLFENKEGIIRPGVAGMLRIR